MTPEAAIVGVLFFGGLFWVLRPVANAAAKRIAGEVPGPLDAAADETVLEELRELRAEVTDLAERVDFHERLLAKQREAARLAPPG